MTKNFLFLGPYVLVDIQKYLLSNSRYGFIVKNSIYSSFMMVKFLHFIFFQNRNRSIIKLSVGMKSVLVLIDWQRDSRVSISLLQWNMPAS